MIQQGFILEFIQLMEAAALQVGVNPKYIITGINKTDIADKAKLVPAKELAFINVFPDLFGEGANNDQLADQAELMFFFLMKANRKSPADLTAAMNLTLNAVIRFRMALANGEIGNSCSWVNRLDWPGSKIIPESNLYELSGWMLTLKTLPI